MQIKLLNSQKSRCSNVPILWLKKCRRRAQACLFFFQWSTSRARSPAESSCLLPCCSFFTYIFLSSIQQNKLSSSQAVTSKKLLIFTLVKTAVSAVHTIISKAQNNKTKSWQKVDYSHHYHRQFQSETFYEVAWKQILIIYLSNINKSLLTFP